MLVIILAMIGAPRAPAGREMMGAEGVNGSMPRILVGIGEFFFYEDKFGLEFLAFEVQLGTFGPRVYMGSCDLHSAVDQDVCIKLVGIQGMKKRV
jgi:hypothetical protein